MAGMNNFDTFATTVPVLLPVRSACGSFFCPDFCTCGIRAHSYLYNYNGVTNGHHFKAWLLQLFGKFPHIQLAKMGFPATLQNQPIWQ